MKTQPRQHISNKYNTYTIVTITNSVLNCTEICLNQLHAFDNCKSFVLSLITAGAKCASRDEVCQAYLSRIIQVIYTIALLRYII